jgi:enterochelin esterase-like enzyme
VRAGRDVTYREFRGGHDHACWRGSLADGIAHLLGGAGGTRRPLQGLGRLG